MPLVCSRDLLPRKEYLIVVLVEKQGLSIRVWIYIGLNPGHASRANGVCAHVTLQYVYQNGVLNLKPLDAIEKTFVHTGDGGGELGLGH